jgi:hypothetical protein
MCIIATSHNSMLSIVTLQFHSHGPVYLSWNLVEWSNFEFFFLKLSIRPKDRLIRGNQSHRPLAGSNFDIISHKLPIQSWNYKCKIIWY